MNRHYDGSVLDTGVAGQDAAPLYAPLDILALGGGENAGLHTFL